MEGVGSVGLSSVFEILRQSSLAFVGTVHNKLEVFAEQDRRSSTKELPEFVKRAVRAYFRGTCATPGCTNLARQIDHMLARTNGGTNEVENLQALCDICHAEKLGSTHPGLAPAYTPKRPNGANFNEPMLCHRQETRCFPTPGSPSCLRWPLFVSVLQR